jgi:uncharacterized membrane protein YdbT with pleckstrin-like domain
MMVISKEIDDAQRNVEVRFMSLLYIWVGIVGILCLMLIGKLIATLVLCCRGLALNWSSYNTTLLVLAGIAFLPVAVLAVPLKNMK